MINDESAVPVLGFRRCSRAAERARKRQKPVVDVDAWRAPDVHIDDLEIVQNPVALGRRYARVALVEQPIKRLREDIQVPPSDLKNAVCALEGMMKTEGARKHLLRLLEENILGTLGSLPDYEWKCRSRENIRPEGMRTTDQFVLGLLPSKGERFGCIPMPTEKTWKLPSLCVALNLYLQIAVPASVVFEVSTISVLRNVESEPHVDGNNKGDSWGLAFGDFEGGGVWVVDGREGADLEYCLREVVRGPTGRIRYKAGTYTGRVLDTRRCPRQFDGNSLHFTVPVRSGTRFAIIFYCLRSKTANQRTPGAMHKYLTCLGFKLPVEAVLRPDCVENQLVELVLNGKPVKDEPGRAPMPRTRGKAEGEHTEVSTVLVSVKEESVDEGNECKTVEGAGLAINCLL
jgi:hypothetical protein